MQRITDSEIQEYEIQNAKRIRETAAECTVLLKKDGGFPLEAAGSIALFGNGARNTIKGGTGSGDVNIHSFQSIENGLASAGFQITTKAWLDGYDSVMHEAKKSYFSALKEQAKAIGIPFTMLAMGKVAPEPEYSLPIEGEGDTAIYVLARNSGEGGDRNPGEGDIRLTETEIRDIKAINEKYEKFMLVLNTGGMVDLTPVREVKNILILGQLGTVTADVLADILLGKSNPSGKLTMSWADIDAYPSTEGFGDMNDTSYKENIYVGYRWFDKNEKGLLYPFGYGLSYSEFAVDSYVMEQGETAITVRCRVENTGRYAGKDIIQVYVAKPESRMDMPVKELVAFQKTKTLEPGESTEITISFAREELKSYDQASAEYVISRGDYRILAGEDSKQVTEVGVLTFDEDIVIDRLTHVCCGKAGPETLVSEEEPENAQGQKVDWSQVKSGEKTVEAFANGLTDRELAYVCCGYNVDVTDKGSIIGAASKKVAGAAGETTGKLLESHGLDSIVMCDGPAGVRVSPVYTLHNGEAAAKEMAFGGDMLEFLDDEDLAAMKAMMAQPDQTDQTEKEETLYYQYCTALPIGTDIAQSFNTELAGVYGDIVGQEMERFGIQLWLAPALNIMRSPLCGRDFEYYSEDPVLSGEIAAAITASVQKHSRCGVTIKHFACNNQETNRYGSNSIVQERALREIYLKGFEICVRKAAPKAVMSSYNLLNGEHTANNRDLLQTVLREEWGFAGMVMTDWFTTTDMMSVPGAKYSHTSAAGCIKARNNLVMPGVGTDIEDIENGLINAEHPYHITRNDLLEASIPVLKTILELT